MMENTAETTKIKSIWEYRTYPELLNLDSFVLTATLEQLKIDVFTKIMSQEEAETASDEMGKLANHYSLVSSLLSYAKAFKRSLKRDKNMEEYEDMIDKEAIIENTLKALDIQYKAVSKSITLYMEDLKVS